MLDLSHHNENNEQSSNTNAINVGLLPKSLANFSQSPNRPVVLFQFEFMNKLFLGKTEILVIDRRIFRRRDLETFIHMLMFAYIDKTQAIVI